jgi:ABC-type Fe3+ transport system permease subunit
MGISFWQILVVLVIVVIPAVVLAFVIRRSSRDKK